MIEAVRVTATEVSASTSSAQSAILTGADVVMESDTAFHFLFGSNPTATTACLRVPANTMVRFTNVKAGEKFAVILGAGTATIRYVEDA